MLSLGGKAEEISGTGRIDVSVTTGFESSAKTAVNGVKTNKKANKIAISFFKGFKNSLYSIRGIGSTAGLPQSFSFMYFGSDKFPKLTRIFPGDKWPVAVKKVLRFS